MIIIQYITCGKHVHHVLSDCSQSVGDFFFSCQFHVILQFCAFALPLSLLHRKLYHTVGSVVNSCCLVLLDAVAHIVKQRVLV